MRYRTKEEVEQDNQSLERLRRKWVGVDLDYGSFTRTVVDVAFDECDRIILYAQGPGETGFCLEPESKWKHTPPAPSPEQVE